MKIDGIGTLSQKSLYDDRPYGFSFLTTDAGDVYFKLSNTSGHWSPPIAFRGHGVPAGGVAGQFLKKNTNAEGDTSWSNLPINNTLTSTSTTQALSAAQGKALKDMLDGHEEEDASISAKGHVQLSTSINSESDSTAATSSAVKTTMDAAVKALTSNETTGKRYTMHVDAGGLYLKEV